jgi:hypothetical protein
MVVKQVYQIYLQGLRLSSYQLQIVVNGDSGNIDVVGSFTGVKPVSISNILLSYSVGSLIGVNPVGISDKPASLPLSKSVGSFTGVNPVLLSNGN